MFNRELFDEAIKRSGYRILFICQQIGISYETFAKKRSGVVQWKLVEIQKLCTILSLNNDERDSIFFNMNVYENANNGCG